MNENDLRQIANRDRHETMRWLLLLTLNISRPNEAPSGMLLSVMKGVYKDATHLEVKRELDYLQGRDLVSLRTDPLGLVFAKLERYGIDIVEYMVDCEPGISRPKAGD